MTLTGTLGSPWRATVTPWGDLVVPGQPPLAWHIAAEDRWHSPADEPSVRQRRVDGTPVTETRVKIPNGDAVQRVWTVADHGGMTFVEVRNDSPRSIAVALTRNDLWLPRPAADVPIEGIELPQSTVALPIGHAGRVVVGLAHRPSHGVLGVQPEPDAVIRGWRRSADMASQLELPDSSIVEAVTALRCDLLLGGVALDGPVERLVAAGELARMGHLDELDAVQVGADTERILRHGDHGWREQMACRGSMLALAALDESVAVADLRRNTSAWQPGRPPRERPPGILGVPWEEHRLVDPRGALLPAGFPDGWLGAPLAAHNLPVDGSRVSFAVRWHGDRPAVLWERDGAPLTLRAPMVAPEWSAAAGRGEALWPAHGPQR